MIEKEFINNINEIDFNELNNKQYFIIKNKDSHYDVDSIFFNNFENNIYCFDVISLNHNKIKNSFYNAAATTSNKYVLIINNKKIELDDCFKSNSLYTNSKYSYPYPVITFDKNKLNIEKLESKGYYDEYLPQYKEDGLFSKKRNFHIKIDNNLYLTINLTAIYTSVFSRYVRTFLTNTESDQIYELIVLDYSELKEAINNSDFDKFYQKLLCYKYDIPMHIELKKEFYSEVLNEFEDLNSIGFKKFKELFIPYYKDDKIEVYSAGEECESYYECLQELSDEEINLKLKKAETIKSYKSGNSPIQPYNGKIIDKYYEVVYHDNDGMVISSGLRWSTKIYRYYDNMYIYDNSFEELYDRYKIMKQLIK